MPNELTFEKSLKQLEAIIEKLEQGNQTLDKSLELFTKGTMLVSICKEKIDQAQCQIKELTDSKENLK